MLENVGHESNTAERVRRDPSEYNRVYSVRFMDKLKGDRWIKDMDTCSAGSVAVVL